MLVSAIFLAISFLFSNLVFSEGLVYDKSNTYVVPSYDPVLKDSVRSMAVMEEHWKAAFTYTTNQTTPGFKENYCANFLDKNGELQVSHFYRLGAGPPIESGNSFDCMIEGAAFFTIQGPWGIGYTRDGRFDLDIHGRLVTFSDHFLVLGQNGPINMDGRDRVVFGSKGEVYVKDELVDTLRLTEFLDVKQLDSFNSNIFFSLVDEGKLKLNENPIYFVRQGYYEGSNVTKAYFGEVARYRYVYYGNTYLVSRALKAYQNAISMANP